MFRENEATRVGAVLERKRAGDVAGMVDAAAQLWLAPVDVADEPDNAAVEVWGAIALGF